MEPGLQDPDAAALAPPPSYRIHVGWSESSTSGKYRGSDRVANGNDAEVRFQELGVQGSARLADAWQAHLRLSYLEIDREENGAEVRHLAGIGDTALYVTWQPHANLTVLGGGKIPTGESSEDPQPGDLQPSLLQLGTGTFDFLTGIQAHTTLGEFRLRGAAAAQLPLGESGADLAPGELYRLQAGAVWLGGLAGWEPAVDLEAEFRGHDTLDGARLANTGSSAWYLRPSFRLRLGDQLSLHTALRFPIARQVSGTQLVPGTLLTAGLELRF